MEKRTTLKKTLKPHWVWAIALGSAIGWGAFVQPVNWMATAGPLGVISGFFIGALLMILIAVSYGFLIKSFPVSGGEFAYTYISLGRTHAFISGWFLTLGYICIVALNASAFALMFKFVFPQFIENLHLYNVAGWEVYVPEIIVASLVLIVFGFFNVRGSSISGRIQFIFCLVMVGAILLLTMMVGIQPEAGLANVKPYFPTDTNAIAAIISIVAIAPWAYVGFDNIPQTAEEFDFSSNKAFKLIVFAILVAAILYSFMIITTSMIRPWQGVVDANYIWGTGQVVQDLLGTAGLLILVIALTMGIFTGLNGFVISSSRLLFAMSRAKIIPEGFSKLHPKYNTPYWGVIFTVIVAMFSPWFGREALLWVVDMSSIGVTIAYFYTCYAAFSMFTFQPDNRLGNGKQLYSPVKKVISILGMLASLTFLVLLLFPGSPAFLGLESRIALAAWVILGLIFYLAKRKEYNKIPEEELNYLITGSKEIKLKQD
ncbi:APC family permease [Gracilibacillus caseinilyticus]|uniref:APC family permease n=1 Tax=Gracilibacillus caseinilyticus TaxID=2932256 RepID=A0ABY4EQV9_9BACI|nr:APC family permease [Gracilibacillus caseinilyticus]UOQ46573.1 APC family permease [Gracilibacillus caseinilyticus]